MTRASGPNRFERRSPLHLLKRGCGMRKAVRRVLFAAAGLAGSAFSPAAAAPRKISLDIAQAKQPFDRFFDLSVGSDYPGTLVRPEAQAQLKTAVDELGFRYLRFHAIFHDVLGTVKVVNGTPR